MPVIVVMLAVFVRVRAALPPAGPQHRRADQHDENARDEVEPGIQLIGDDESGEQQRDRAECQDADRMRRGNDQAEERCVARRSGCACWRCIAIFRRSRESRTDSCRRP